MSPAESAFRRGEAGSGSPHLGAAPYTGPASWAGRGERLIAAGRTALAVSALVTIWLDPTAPSRYVGITYSLLAAYAIYAVVLAVLVWLDFQPLIALRLPTHALDIALFTVFMYLTDGVASPFFAYFVFAIVCGGVRWRWRGALTTALVSLAAFLGLGLYAQYVLHDPNSRLDRFVLRASYLSVVAGFIVYLGAYEEQIREEIQRLVRWPRALVGDRAPLLQQLARHAAHVLGAPRSAIVWLVDGASVPSVTTWSAAGTEHVEAMPSRYVPLVADVLRDAPFMCRDVRRRQRVLFVSDASLREYHGVPLNEAFLTDFRVGSVLALPLSAAGGSGWLFFFEKAHLSADDLEIGRITAREVAASMDHSAFVTRSRDHAVQEARTRLGRDLHDGLLQSLTAVRLQVHALARGVSANGMAALTSRLDTIEAAIGANQRDLRLVVEQLRHAPSSSVDAWNLDDAVTALRERMNAEWDLTLDARIVAGAVPPSLQRELFLLAQEALVNAARHGHATNATVRVETRDAVLSVRVQDNGSGFPFVGRLSASELAELNLCPTSISDRVLGLGGTFAVESTKSGAIVDIRIPLARETHRGGD